MKKMRQKPRKWLFQKLQKTWQKLSERHFYAPHRKGLRRGLLTIDLLIIFNFFLAAVVLYLITDAFFRFEVVKLAGTYSVPSGLDTLRGRSLLFTKETDIVDWLLERNVGFSSLEVKKQPPNSVMILIKKREAVAQLISAGYVYLIDKEGVVFKAVKETVDLPVLEALTGNIMIGDKFDKSYSDSIFALLKELRLQAMEVESITVKNPDEIVIKVAGTLIISDTHQDVNVVSSSLQMMLAGFRIEGKIPRVIDVRFDKPVVRF